MNPRITHHLREGRILSNPRRRTRRVSTSFLPSITEDLQINRSISKNTWTFQILKLEIYGSDLNCKISPMQSSSTRDPVPLHGTYHLLAFPCWLGSGSAVQTKPCMKRIRPFVERNHCTITNGWRTIPFGALKEIANPYPHPCLSDTSIQHKSTRKFKFECRTLISESNR